MPESRPPLAVVGVSALFPGSQDASGFWRDILAGKDLMSDVPPSHWLIEDYYDPDPQAPDKTYARRGAFLSPIEFDPLEHGIPPSVVPATDTCQLLALVAAKQVLEDALGSQFTHVDRERVSVILGVTSGQELLVQMGARLQRPVWRKALRERGLPEDEVEAVCERIAASYSPWQEMTFPGLLGNVVAGRIANRLNLGGTNCITDAACASSLSALAMGASELYLGQSDLVIVGGVETFNDIFMFMCFSKTPAMSPTGDCRPFSQDADGTMLGEGIGMLALRRLEDAERDGDRIYAVVRGIGSSSDGRAKSIYAPVAEGQAKALRRAYEAAGYGPETVELVEAHGTGTKAGDVAEFEGLRQVFDESGRADRQWCALGSVKSQVGHAKAAAGAAGLFKAVMALHHKVLPPTIKVTAPQEGLKLEESPFYLNTEARPWVRDARHPRRASVSSFGFGGSNFHVAAEEYAGPGRRAARVLAAPTHLVVLDAADPGALATRCRELARSEAGIAGALPAIARESRETADPASPARLAIVATDEADLAAKLEQAAAAIARSPETAFASPAGIHYALGATPGGIAFLFPGQGSQYLRMGADLATTFDVAREVWDRAASLDLPLPLHEIVFPRPVFDEAAREALVRRLTATEWAQPAIGLVSTSHLALLRSFGVDGAVFGGHSFGEVTALHATGALDFGAFLGVARKRGELMAAAAERPGAMIAVAHAAEEVKALLAGWEAEVVVANHNSPRQVVLSGAATAVDEVAARLREKGLTVRPLPVSTAFHSPLVAPSSVPFRAFLAGLPLSAPGRPVYSNAAAAPYPAEPDAIRDRLAEQIARPVRFAEEIEAMYAAGARTFVEVGPGSVLTQLVEQCLEGREHRAIATDRKGQHGLTSLWHALGRLFAAGVPLAFDRLDAPFARPSDPRTRRKPALSLPISGANYAKPYPPTGGAAALPKPNPPRPATASTSAAPPVTPAHAAPAAAGPQGSVPSASGETAAWVQAYQEVQRQTAEAHEAYLRTTAEAHQAFLRAAEASYAALGAALTGQPIPLSSLPATAAPSLPLEAPLVPGPAVVAPSAFPAPAPLPVSAGIAVVQPAPVAAPAAASVRQTLLEVVAEKTGYPAEMLRLEMELESDLGIDSIKRVEILAAMQEKVPGLPEVKAADMAALRTLGHIVTFLERSVPPAAAAPAAAPPAPPVPAQAERTIAKVATAVPTNGKPGHNGDLKEHLLAVVAEKTGYPAEMLRLEMELESDLGIDSIKRVEILAALQERVPDLPEVKAAELAALRTLGHIVARMGVQTAAAQTDAPAASTKSGGGPAGLRTAVSRFGVRALSAPPLGSCVRGLADGRTVYLAGDDGPLAEALAAELSAHGLPSGLARSVEDAPEARAVVFMGGLRTVATIDEALQVQHEAFRWARHLAPRTGDGVVFATVQDTGGDFGLSGGDALRAWLAGLPGLVKTAAQEWPGSGLKAIDVERAGRSAVEVAAHVARELLMGGPELEVGLLAEGSRVTLRADVLPATPGAPAVDSESVIVSTGGARGVTAACLLALARAHRPRIALLGRTPLAEEPAGLRGLADEASLTRALLEHHRAGGRVPSPAELRAQAHTILAQREVVRTMHALEEAGARVVYLATDVQDGVALGAALEEVRRRFGPITGVVHGAGVLADKAIAEKTDAQFERVFATKVAGLRHLLAATAEDPLRLLLLFSSVAARAGNPGQSDYAMANETLNKVAAAEARRRGPSCVVRSLGWGPWDGGMVGPGLKQLFTSRGVGLIPIEGGAAAFAAEAAAAPEGPAEVVLGASADGEGSLLGTGPRTSLELDVVAGARTLPFLDDHRVGGAVVVPVALALEWFARAASALRPDLELAALRDVRVRRGIRLEEFGRQARLLRLVCRETSNGSGAFVALELRGAEGALHYTAQAEMVPPGTPRPAPAGGEPAAPLHGAPLAVEDLYRSVLFHGPRFHAIREVEAVGPEGARARLVGTRALGWEGGPWRLDPAALDAALQLAIVWGRESAGMATLPTGVGEVLVYQPGAVDGLLCCRLLAREATALRTLSDVVLEDAAGRPVAWMRGVEMHAATGTQPAIPEPEAEALPTPR
jgi:acyl transferase domain-containing protein